VGTAWRATGNGMAEQIVVANQVAELDGGRIAACFATNTHFQSGVRAATLDSHIISGNAVAVQGLEWI
jgi:hypothetical protein